MKLYGNLLYAAGQHFYYALDSVPGVLTPATAQLSLNGQTPNATQFVSVFRTPAQAALTLQGGLVSTTPVLIPATATLVLAGLTATEQRLKVITPTVNLDYSAPQDLAPTILFINTITPAPAALRMSPLTFNLTQGGNIAVALPGFASLTLAGKQVDLPNDFPMTGALNVSGLVPSLARILLVTPDPGALSMNGQVPGKETPFAWVDVPRQTPTTWTTSPRAA